MRVLFLVNAWVHDGPGALIRGLVPRLAARPALRVEAAALRGARGDGSLKKALEQAGVPCHDVPSGPFDFLQARALRGLVERGKFDVVVASLARPDLAARRALRDAKAVELVAIEHGPHAWKEKGFLGRLAKRTYHRTIGRVRTIACVSEAVRWELFRTGVQGERLRVIHNGVDPDLFRPADEAAKKAARERFGIPADAVAIGCAGAFKQWLDQGAIKGQDTLVDAFALLAANDAIPADTRSRLVLALAGHGPMEDALRAQAAKLGDRVRFIGRMEPEETPSYFQALDLYAQPSRVESFGLALCEAMATELPVACAETGGIVETYRDDAGLILPAGEPAAWAAALAKLVQATPEERRAMGEAGRRNVVENFSIESCAANWAELLENIPRPRLEHDAHLEAVRRGEKGLKGAAADAPALGQEIALSAQKFAEAYDADEGAAGSQEDLYGKLVSGDKPGDGAGEPAAANEKAGPSA